VLISYAQNFEDVMLWRALGHVTNGFYIDIGAQEPVVDSVSLAFYERGWRGVHVEPSPMFAEKLRQARPDETVIQAAVDSNKSLIKFYEFPETGWSTGEAEIAQEHQAAGLSFREIEVPSLTLASLLDRYADREIHWLKIDVEGMEKRVIESWRPSRVRPWILVVESMLPNKPTSSHQAWDPLVLLLGYKFVYSDGLNRFYVSKAHRELKDAFLVGPNLFDDFALSGTSGTFCRVLHERHREQLNEMRLEFEKQTESSQQRIEHLNQAINAKEQVQAEQARLHAEREQAFTEQLLAGQRELLNLEREWARAEKALNQEIAGLQSEIQALNNAQQLQAQQQGFELTTKQDELNRLVQTCADHEAQLKAQVLSKQQTILQLRQKIAEVEKNLAITHASLSWRMTSPLRKMTSFIAPRKDPGHSFSSLEQAESTTVIEPTVSESQPTKVQPSSQAATGLILPHSTQTINLNGPPIAATLDELLARHDQSFIHCAYQTLLGRDPDEEGLNYYLGRLRSGIPKIQILGQLRRSEEGRDYAADLPRLDTTIRRYRWAQKAIIGGLVRLFSKVEGNNFPERQLRGLESRLFLLGEESNRRFDQMEQALTGLHQQTDQIEQINVVMATKGSTAQANPEPPTPPLEPSEPEGLKLLSPRARDIYFQLKTAAAIHARSEA
jgi:FkbM family methyltransferase